jgi:hypothetical protein
MNTELQPIRDAIESSETVTAHKNVAATADRNAKEHLQTREVAQTAVKQIQNDWVKLLEIFERLKGELDGARGALQYGQEQSNLRRSRYDNWQIGTNLQYLDGARDVATTVAALEILADRVVFKENLLAKHVEQMRAFGKEHGIDQETLKQLSGPVRRVR